MDTMGHFSVEPNPPALETARARGLFSQFGWQLHLGPESDGLDARLVSTHELHHDRLQVTTAHGFLIHVVAALYKETGEGRWGELEDGLQAVAYRVHEQFATWMSATTLGLSRDELAGHLPSYLGYFDDAQELVASAPSPYLRMHLVYAAHRAAMQSEVLRIAADRGIAELRLADLDRTQQPDWRIARFDPRAFDGFAADVERRWGGDERWPALLASTLSTELYGLAYEDIWDDVNQRAYELARRVLSERGARALEYDGHTGWTAPALEQARKIAGTRLGVRLGSEMPEMPGADVAVFSMEGETIVLRDAPLPAVVLDCSPLDMIAGEEPFEHVYVSIRQISRLRAQWLTEDPDAIGSSEVVALARRTVLTEEGRLVELCPVADPQELSGSQVPIYGDISMAVLDDGPRIEAWESLIRPDRFVVLWDLRPTHHIRLWLGEPGHRLRYCVLNAERSGRTTMVFVAQVISDGGRSRLFVAPSSDLFVRSLRAWLVEAGLDERAVLDEGLAAEADTALQIGLGHMLGEEMTFDFLAGRRP